MSLLQVLLGPGMRVFVNANFLNMGLFLSCLIGNGGLCLCEF